MARINLMPWREKRRKQRQQEFMVMLAAAAVLAIAILVVAWFVRAGQVEHQEARNARLTQEIELMKEQAEQIQDLDIKRDRLLGRKQVIEELQSNRSHMVHLLDQLVRTVPEGIQLVSVVQKGPQLTIEGRSESNARVSEYLRQLEASEWLDSPDLKVIEEQIPASARKDKDVGPAPLPYFFRLNVTLVNPHAPKLDADGNPIAPEDLPAAAAATASGPVAQDASATPPALPALPAEVSSEVSSGMSSDNTAAGSDTGSAAAPVPAGAHADRPTPTTAPPVDPNAPTLADKVPGKATLDRVRAMDAQAREDQARAAASPNPAQED